MAPEMSWVKDAADIIGNVGLPGFCAFLLYLLREQRTEMKSRDTAYTAKVDALNAEMKVLLKGTTEVAERSTAGLTKAAEASDEAARRTNAGIELLRVVATQSETNGRTVEKNYERLGQMSDRLQAVSEASGRLADRAGQMLDRALSLGGRPA
jgi:methyl-accepting chemotaxis protein